MYVLDTHTLLWHLTTDKKLSKKAAAIFKAAERGETQLVISSIVLAELYFTNQKWNLFPNFAATYHDIKNSSYFRLVPFQPDEVPDFDADVAVPEMHDRIIAGLARRLNAPLLTADPLIQASGVARIVW